MIHGRRGPSRPGWLALALALPLLGCSRPAAPGLVPVSGKVTVDDHPLPRGRVLFRPDVNRGNQTPHHPSGAIQPDGSYHLCTARAAGAPRGWYRVVIFAAEPSSHPSGASPGIPKWLIDPRYTQEETTDLLIEVVDHPAAGAYELRVKGIKETER
jgi:hypothetical protein